MIRVLLSTWNRAYGYDITGWEGKQAYDLYYDNLLTEDLVTRINEGDVIMYFDCNESAEDWCKIHEFEYKLLEPDENN